MEAYIFIYTHKYGNIKYVINIKYKYSNSFDNFSYKNPFGSPKFNNMKIRKFPSQLYLANVFQEILFNHFREAELSKG
jgi:hypothetical protein